MKTIFLVAEFAEAERDAQLAAMDVRLIVSFLKSNAI
jgi:hypothetical protein